MIENTQNNIRDILENHPLIPVVTFNTMEEIDGVMSRLSQQHIHCIEITLRTPIAYEAIEYVKKTYGTQFTIGMGTVINGYQIEKAIRLGLDFMVSPAINDHLALPLIESKIGFLPGIVTPSEILLGMQNHWDTFKFFPGSCFGGAETLKAYGQVFPELKFCPTGGINENNYKDYLDLKNVISVGGSWMVK